MAVVDPVAVPSAKGGTEESPGSSGYRTVEKQMSVKAWVQRRK
jgi:hypothetical protein